MLSWFEHVVHESQGKKYESGVNNCLPLDIETTVQTVWKRTEEIKEKEMEIEILVISGR